MKTLILAAGRSRRFQPLPDKNNVEILGQPVLEHQFRQLHEHGLSEVILAVGEHNRATLEPIAQRHGATVVIQENPEDGMAGAILAAEPHVGDAGLLIINSGDILGPEAYRALNEELKSAPEACLLAKRVTEYFPGGYLQLDGDRVISIVEKPGAGKEPSDLVNLVLHYYREPARLFEALKQVDTQRDDRYEVAMDRLMKELTFTAIPYKGLWQPLKYPWHTLDLMQSAFESMEPSIHPSAQIAETAVLRGPVTLAAGVKIFDNAVIQGPAYLGENTVVANNALVRQSMIGANCVVGYSTEIARSLIGQDCWFHSNYVGDTVMGNNVSFGAGAVCANLRLDEKDIAKSGRNKLGPILGDHIRIGVNTSLMPGVRISSNTMIASGLTIAQDIEPGKFVYGKTELIIKGNRAQLDPTARAAMKGRLNT